MPALHHVKIIEIIDRSRRRIGLAHPIEVWSEQEGRTFLLQDILDILADIIAAYSTDILRVWMVISILLDNY